MDIRQIKRKAILEKHKHFLDQMIKQKPSINYRRWLNNTLIDLANYPNENIDFERKYIGSFNYGIFWNVEVAFKTKKELDIIKEIIDEFKM